MTWVTGDEKCRWCGFVPIGAGLWTVSVTSQRRIGPPGSVGSYAFAFLLLAVMAFAIEVRPWRNDWEWLRIQTGDERPTSVVGTWQIERSVPVDVPGGPETPEGLQGSMVFTPAGKVRLVFMRDVRAIDVAGTYAVYGNVVYLRNLQSVDPDGDAPLPPVVRLRLRPQSDGRIIARIEQQEELTLRRLRPDEMH